MRRLALTLAVAALAGSAPALAATPRPSLFALESQLVCIQCHETLDMSTSPLAEQMKLYIRRFIAEGWSAQRIKAYFVKQFGEQVLADPPTHGFNLLAWVIPLTLGGLGLVAVGGGAWVWTRKREDGDDGAGEPGGATLPSALELRVDQELAAFDA